MAHDDDKGSADDPLAHDTTPDRRQGPLSGPIVNTRRIYLVAHSPLS